jgi:WD40 repeat protein
MIEGHANKITQLSFQHRADLLASGDADGVVMIWSPLRSSQHVAGRYFESTISRLEWSPDNQLLAVGERSGIVTGLQLQ